LRRSRATDEREVVRKIGVSGRPLLRGAIGASRERGGDDQRAK
jgi:hypothetical protein